MNVWDLFKLDGKAAFVTGGARNLGYDMALALAEAGADVAITARSLEKAEASGARIAAATGRSVLALQLEVTDEQQVEAVVAAILARFGRINILVNNAGNVVSTPESAPFERRSLADWQNTIDVNLTGVFLCSKHVVAKAMKPQRSGVIINIGSTTGVIGKDRRVYQGTDMGGATLDYHAAKGGVISMTRDMAVYLAPDNIRVNCISPGGFWRNQPEAFVKAYNETIPMGRMGQDGKEMKGAVVFLASEASSYCTGTQSGDRRRLERLVGASAMAQSWQGLRALVVGCGSIGKRHSRVLRELGVTTLFGCDPAPEQLQAAATQAQFDSVAESFAAGLALKPDVVFLCTPPALHISQALQAVEHGCHVFSEKPLSVDLEGTDELARSLALTGRKFMVGLCFRYHRGLLRAKRLLDEGRIGRIVSIRALMGEHLPAVRPDYRDLYLARCSGAFELVHDIDLALWYAGQDVRTVRSICGVFSDIGIEAADLVEILMEFSDRCVASVHLDFFALPRRRQIELMGTRGTITVEFASWDQCTISIYDLESRAWAVETFATDRDDMFRDEDRDFLQAAAGGRPIACTLAEGAKSLDVVLKAQQVISTRSGGE